MSSMNSINLVEEDGRLSVYGWHAYLGDDDAFFGSIIKEDGC